MSDRLAHPEALAAAVTMPPPFADVKFEVAFSLLCADVKEVVGALQVLITKFEAVTPFQQTQVLDQIPSLRYLILRTPRRSAKPLQAVDFYRRQSGSVWSCWNPVQAEVRSERL